MTSVSKNVYIDKLADIFNEPWTHAIEDLNGEKIARAFHEKELQKPNQKEFAIERAIKRKVISYFANGEVIIILLTVGLMKKIVI